MIKKNHYAGGFTLIEMLIVIAIIGILSTVALVALGPSRNKAKDARIVSDMNQVSTVMETLFNADTGKYPDSSVAMANTAISAAGADIAASGGQSFTISPSTGDF
jgi:prepilin-type N-terminal cleavage/methylation domain-containing protein